MVIILNHYFRIPIKHQVFHGKSQVFFFVAQVCVFSIILYFATLRNGGKVLKPHCEHAVQSTPTFPWFWSHLLTMASMIFLNFNIDSIKKLPYFGGVTFSKASFWVSIFQISRVYVKRFEFYLSFICRNNTSGFRQIKPQHQCGDPFLWAELAMADVLAVLEGDEGGRFFSWWWFQIPSLKLTQHLKMVVSNWNLLFQRSIFRCYVSFRECIFIFHPETWGNDPI